jgi:hypothetical protein
MFDKYYTKFSAQSQGNSSLAADFTDYADFKINHVALPCPGQMNSNEQQTKQIYPPYAIRHPL